MRKISFLKEQIHGISFSTDIIVGFPDETENDFRQTLELLREVEFQKVYSFTYSPRPGTVAAGVEDRVSREEKAERLQRLLSLQETIQTRENATLVGRSFEVLVDGNSRMDAQVVKGRTTCNRIVHLPATSLPRGAFVCAQITRAHARSLTGAVHQTPHRLDSDPTAGYKGESPVTP